MDLNEHTAKQFHSALLSAFPNWTDLAIMVRHQLNQRLANLAGGPEQELRATAFKLIDASEAQGRLDGLLAAALAAAPDNPELQAFAHTIGYSAQVTNRPEILVGEIIAGTFNLGVEKAVDEYDHDHIWWQLYLDLYLEPYGEHPVIIPFHRCQVQAIFDADLVLYPCNHIKISIAENFVPDTRIYQIRVEEPNRFTIAARSYASRFRHSDEVLHKLDKPIQIRAC